MSRRKNTKKFSGEAVFRILKRRPKKGYSFKEISKKLSNRVFSKEELHDTLQKLVKEKRIEQFDKNKYRLNFVPKETSSTPVRGKIDMASSGYAFLIVEGRDKDAFISARNLNGALQDDIVEAVLTERKANKPEGVVKRIVERSRSEFVCTLSHQGDYAFGLPNMKNMVDIYIPSEKIGRAKDGEKVLVKIVQWSKSSNKSPVGAVKKILGLPGTDDVEMMSILLDKGLNASFNKSVIRESEKINIEIPQEEIANRLDYRNILTFTIDPEDAKDFDDAISYEVLPNGNYSVGVHIADVSHYVKENTALDKEALERGNSVYLVDRVIPMLPERLSNGVCSLRPHEEKLTCSVIFEFDQDFNIVNHKIARTITYSDHRFTYETAQEVLEGKSDIHKDALLTINKIAEFHKGKRFENGAISFESDEVKFKLDEKGVPIFAYVKERKAAHMLIEEYMLLANKYVATFISEKGKKGRTIPFDYRIHDKPDELRLEDLKKFVEMFGYKLDITNINHISKNLNQLMKAVLGKPEASIITKMTIRTMSKAKYSTENIGHFGLGFENYGHFTSPIRRYADVLVHRIVFENLTETKIRDAEYLQQQCQHISEMEKKAQSAERESIKYKQVEFMKSFIGKKVTGMITGIIDYGIFVEVLDNKCEGLMHFDGFDEHFVVDGNRLSAIGNMTQTKFKMGDIIDVVVKAADLENRTIDFAPVMEDF